MQVTMLSWEIHHDWGIRLTSEPHQGTGIGGISEMSVKSLRAVIRKSGSSVSLSSQAASLLRDLKSTGSGVISYSSSWVGDMPGPQRDRPCPCFCDVSEESLCCC